MISLKVDVRGLDAAIGRLVVEYPKAFSKAVRTSAAEMAGDAQRSIQRGGRSGVIVNVSKTGQPHQRSAPGEPPATDTGRLVSSIGISVDADGLGAAVGTGVLYGRFLEFGTTKMAARPWLVPAFERTRRRFFKAIVAAAREAARRSKRR